MELKDFESAHETIGKLNDIGKLDTEMAFVDAQALRRMGEHLEAKNALESLAQISPNDARVFRELGLLLADDLKDPLLARRYLSRAIALDPTQVDLIGRSHELSGPNLPALPSPGVVPGPPSSRRSAPPASPMTSAREP